jgi:predicted ThiF/HesA family dinucleotide-utilizing enzyme
MIHIFGCGALGSHVALHLANLARGYDFTLWDDDRVEQQNILTSAYWTHHIGALKVNALADMMYRKAHARAIPRAITLTSKPNVDLQTTDLAIDSFDNSDARALTTNLGVPTLHIGVSAQRTGQITWNEHYRVPESDFERGQNPICTNQLGQKILWFTAWVAANIAEDFLITGNQDNVITTENGRIFR